MAQLSESETRALQALLSASLKTGLSVDTCYELLTKGWSYVEKLDCVPRWEPPLASIPKTITSIDLPKETPA